MNKQELIKKYEMKGEQLKEFPVVAIGDVLKNLRELDEPKPVKIPQFVADWIEYFKKTGDWDLFQAMDYLFGKKKKSGNGLRIKTIKKHLLEHGWTATRSRKRNGIWLRLKGILKKIRWFMENFRKGISLQNALL